MRRDVFVDLTLSAVAVVESGSDAYMRANGGVSIVWWETRRVVHSATPKHVTGSLYKKESYWAGKSWTILYAFPTSGACPCSAN